MTDLIAIYIPKKIHTILRKLAFKNDTTISALATKILQKELIKKPNVAFAKYIIEEHKKEENK